MIGIFVFSLGIGMGFCFLIGHKEYSKVSGLKWMIMNSSLTGIHRAVLSRLNRFKNDKNGKQPLSRQ